MPYIDQNRRDFFKEEINALIVKLQSSGSVSAGDINYIFSEILAGALAIDDNPKYDKINTAVGVLDCVKLELYRRVAGPYEDYKISKSGDTVAYKRFLKWLSRISCKE